MATIPAGTLSKPRRCTTCSNGSDPEFYARTEAAFHRLDQADAGEHGAVDTALFPPTERCANTPSNGTSGCYHLRERAANKGAVGQQIVDWQHAIERSWGLLRFGEVRVDTSAEHHVFEVEIFLNGSTRMRCESNSMQSESAVASLCGKQ